MYSWENGKKYATHEMHVTDMKSCTLTLKLRIQMIAETLHVWGGDRGAVCARDSTAKTLHFRPPSSEESQPPALFSSVANEDLFPNIYSQVHGWCLLAQAERSH